MDVRGLGRRASWILCALLLVAVVADPATARAGRSATEDAVAEALVSMINAERQARGLPGLSWASDSYAQQRADGQPQGRTDRHAGYSGHESAAAQGLGSNWFAAEVLFHSPIGSAGDAVRGWMESDVHRNVLMNSDITVLSVGVACHDGALHAVGHVGSSSGGTYRETPPGTVTAAEGPDCESAPTTAPTPDPEPVPEPAPIPASEPAPTPDPARTPEPAPEPSPASRPPAPTPTAMPSSSPAPTPVPVETALPRRAVSEDPAPARSPSEVLALDEVAAARVGTSAHSSGPSGGPQVVILLAGLATIVAMAERRRARARRGWPGHDG
ncbi:MAG: CAP domain-containing protein [Nitriliruptorales bacterium]|nr:CAP domain-containing protein [Nitriliruptorales bacterium]